MSSAEEPLISRGTSPSPDPDTPFDDDEDTTAAGSDHAATASTPPLFVYLLTFSAGISGLLFGCTPRPPPPVSPNQNPLHSLP